MTVYPMDKDEQLTFWLGYTLGVLSKIDGADPNTEMVWTAVFELMQPPKKDQS